MWRDLALLSLVQLFRWMSRHRWVLRAEMWTDDEGWTFYTPIWHDTKHNTLQVPPWYYRWGQWASETVDCELAWVEFRVSLEED